MLKNKRRQTLIPSENDEGNLDRNSNITLAGNRYLNTFTAASYDSIRASRKTYTQNRQNAGQFEGQDSLSNRLNEEAKALDFEFENRINNLKERAPNNKFVIKEAESLRADQMNKERKMIA